MNRALTNTVLIQAEERPKDAAERERLTKEAITEGHRRMILQIAETWRLLVEQREHIALTRGIKTKLAQGEKIG